MPKHTERLSRAAPRFKPSEKILVVCEDLKSSRDYLISAKKHFRAHLSIDVHHCGKTDPMGLYKYASKQSASYDQVYLVFDRDSHKNFEDAITAIRQNKKLNAIVSYPCFELWILFHFQYTRKSFTAVGGVSAADRLIKDLKKIHEMAGYDKGDAKLLFEQLRDKLETARVNGKRSLEDAAKDNELNPSTSLHILLSKIESMQEPTKS